MIEDELKKMCLFQKKNVIFIMTDCYENEVIKWIPLAINTLEEEIFIFDFFPFYLVHLHCFIDKQIHRNLMYIFFELC